jgi:hypothetical protein
MSTEKRIPTYEVLPIDPENNPPETIEELETLISKLQSKSASIKQQLEVVTILEKQGRKVDYTRVKRSIFARTQTNKSIAALQKILKNRRQAMSITSDNAFEKFFFAASRDKLSAELFSAVLEDTYNKMRTAESIKAKADK